MLGHATALTCHRQVIHSRGAASLPARGRQKGICYSELRRGEGAVTLRFDGHAGMAFVLLAGKPGDNEPPDALLRLAQLRVCLAPGPHLPQFLLYIHGRIGLLPLGDILFFNKKLRVVNEGNSGRSSGTLFRLCAINIGMGWTGLVWIGLVWTGLVWYGITCLSMLGHARAGGGRRFPVVTAAGSPARMAAALLLREEHHAISEDEYHRSLELLAKSTGQ